MPTPIPYKLSLVLVFSSLTTFVGCSLYRSPDREAFNSNASNARTGAPTGIAVTLIECIEVTGALEGSQLEAVQVNRASPDGIHVFMSMRQTSTTPQVALCQFVASKETNPSDQSLSDAARPIVEKYLLTNF